ncbi:MAG: peptide chain release factor I [Candidatus Handelsmanbacteria bacterium RIFCSPLOWO2_12_FULL_64_10]|uniref:Peptide chain release factor I n=1 Tax=Handelsmanbacteria sp. (strain RIFCSPLOWO2_12_FULL_64_10) TaxID=1817868 RepID=A0A1F6CU03_HANXR|nr:MAG: peptide chain release factor I [Candidatus Handelsmanbacteria bacterium RIFCSPLOWO2_12_FULL_64_10]
MIQITPSIAVHESELQEEFIRASGPGGQNVNKVATAVQLRFDAARSPSMPDEVRERLISLAGRRMTEDGVLIITSRRFRTQERNRQDALEKLVGWIRRAAVKPRPRRTTRPTQASKRRRMEEKRRRGEIKRIRRSVPRDED